MTAVEIEEALSDLASGRFDAADFPFQFLAAFGAKDVTIARLRDGHSNTSDLPGGVLQRNNIHVAIAHEGEVSKTLSSLRTSPKTKTGKAKFILATDGITVEAENLGSGELLGCDYAKTGDHFGFFLPLAGINPTRELTDNPIDIKATLRLNKLYVELLRENPDWSSVEKRSALNRFLARLIFCFFAEDTGIFLAHQQFTSAVEQMSDNQSKNTHEIIEHLFQVMDTKTEDRGALNIRPWAAQFPYVNGALFSGDRECPRFTKLARSYLLSAGSLDWKDINPDIFGSMIQAVADEGGDDDEGESERGSLGMHYTSVPNILKVLNPLFLDDLRERLDSAGLNTRRLRAIRRRLATVRIFDPACGSGNFLVIAYLQMREIEHTIAERLGDDPRSWIRLENFYGIEVKGFAAEIARLALLIAEFQADCRYVSEQQARLAVLPLHKTGQIHVANALRVDWLAVCPPAKALVEEHDLLGPTGRLVVAEDASDDGATPETFVCSNPPYRGSKWQNKEQKYDLLVAWRDHPQLAKTTDYVSGWLAQAERYLKLVPHASAAFVMTNSVVQGQQASNIWGALFDAGLAIKFAHRSFKWQNLAANNAGVTVVVVGIALSPIEKAFLYEDGHVRDADTIGCYLLPNQTTIIRARDEPISALPPMVFGNMARDGGHLILDDHDLAALRLDASPFVCRFVGSQELIDGIPRHCLWINDDDVNSALRSPMIASRLEHVRQERLSSIADSTRAFAASPYRFVQRVGVASHHTIAIPGVSSEGRDYLPCDVLGRGTVISNKNFGIFDGDLWVFALIVSRLHLVWTATVCVRLEMRYSYSNTIGWNNFPVPLLTENAKADLTRCAERILLAREAHYPASIADLYKPGAIPDNLKRAHEENDEILERIYVGRRFRNDTERLEHLFELYDKMTAIERAVPKTAKKAKHDA